MKNVCLALLVAACFFACKNKTGNKNGTVLTDLPLFTEINPKQSQVNFKNALQESFSFNFLNYPYIYIGAGVATGDINNDGLEDLYFTSNQNSNKLYINKGDFKFEDITVSAKVADNTGWSTGVSMIDINNDGWLDIYVCKAGSLKSNDDRRNKLFINQKNNSFKESAASYGLDHPGFSTQAYFLDYDKDGDLDLYLVNHRPDFKNNSRISTALQSQIMEISSDQLFRNDGQNFTKVSQEAGILNKAWGLSASIGDFNSDGWPDIYVANDYLEPDMLYINNKNGGFKNEILDRMNHISFNSMGSDYADVNNDNLPDLIVLDMLAEDHSRGKENMASMSTSNFNSMVKIGYHRQYMSNVLQLNNGHGDYSDIGQLSGITKTDWSWAPLIADFDNDGFKDVFITNGIEKDLGNQDFRNRLKAINDQKVTLSLDSLLNMVPADKLSNYMFKNNGDLTFTKSSKDWGIDKKVNSNGAAYVDLDNDGDLDLVVNNHNAVASIYKNNTTQNSIRVKLKGDIKNPRAIGAQVIVKTDKGEQLQEVYANRGFLSSVSNTLNFGVGDLNSIEKLTVVWPDSTRTSLNDLKVNRVLEVDYSTPNNSTAVASNKKKNKRLFKPMDAETIGINFKHEENLFDDYSKQLLLPQKQSTLGPCIEVTDINNDGLDDFFVGGAHNQSAMLYQQQADGRFLALENNTFKQDAPHEDVGALFLDVDNDGDQDLYVASGGYEFEQQSALYQDRLYINDGQGSFTKSKRLPKMHSNTKAVRAIDINKDGFMDLIVGGRVKPQQYPLAEKSYVLLNTNGQFKDVTTTVAPEFKTLGMISDLAVFDYNNDGEDDFVAVGPWLPITVFQKEGEVFKKLKITDFQKTAGWHYSIAVSDIDKDGDQDFVIGNIGGNNKFSPTTDKPLHIFSEDFDSDGSYDLALSKEYKGKLVPTRGKECSSEQTPYLTEKISTYKEFASLNIQDIYGDDIIEKSNHLYVHNFHSLYAENLGNNEFKLKNLPTEAQLGPTLDIEIIDVNNDGHDDIVGIGNFYDAEVETIRYDASRGYILLGDSEGNFNYQLNSGFKNNSDMRALTPIKRLGKKYLMVANNNGAIHLFETLEVN